MRFPLATRRLLSSIPQKTAHSAVEPASVAASETQAPNRAAVWSRRQEARREAMAGPRFVGVNLEAQPKPPAAIELLKQHPVTLTESRSASCDGGGGALGHPRVFINLDDTDQPVACGYCGQRFQQKPHSHH